MSYKNLRNFSYIIGQEDFDYISNIHQINQIIKIILFNISVPDNLEEVHIKVLEEFLFFLDSFYKSIVGNKIPKIAEGYVIVRQEMVRAINILKLSEDKRMRIKERHLKKFSKRFLFGLSMVYDGLKQAFQTDLLPLTNITPNQIARFIFDKNEGLGSKFAMNKAKGRFTFVHHIIRDLSKGGLIKTIETLEKRIPSAHPSIGEWKIMGDGKGINAIRIHYTEGFFTKPKLYRIYRVYSSDEHTAHIRDATSLKVNDCPFIAA